MRGGAGWTGGYEGGKGWKEGEEEGRVGHGGDPRLADQRQVGLKAGVEEGGGEGVDMRV